MCNAHCASPLSLLQVFPTMPTTIPTTLLPNHWLATNHKNEPQKPRSRRNHSNQLKETLEPKGSLQFMQRNEETTAKNHRMLWVLNVFKQLLISLLFSNHFSRLFHVFVSTLSKYVTLDLGSWIMILVHGSCSQTSPAICWVLSDGSLSCTQVFKSSGKDYKSCRRSTLRQRTRLCLCFCLCL